MKISLKGNKMQKNEISSYSKAIMNIKQLIQQDKIVLLAFLFSIIAGSSSILKELFGSFNINYIFVGLIILSSPYNLLKKRKLNQINNIAIPLSFYAGFVFLCSSIMLFWGPAIDLFIFSITIFAVSLVIPVLYWITKKKLLIYTLLFFAFIISLFGYHLTYSKEIFIAKRFLNKIKTGDYNEDSFLKETYFVKGAFFNNSKELYYYFKIWLEQNEVSSLRIYLASVTSCGGKMFAANGDEKMFAVDGNGKMVTGSLGFDLILKKKSDPIGFNIRDHNIRAVFIRTNYRNFYPDYNKDGKIDQLDLDWVIEDKKKE